MKVFKILLPNMSVALAIGNANSTVPTRVNGTIPIAHVGGGHAEVHIGAINGTDAGITLVNEYTCSWNIGLIEYFPRGGTTGGRIASIRMGPVNHHGASVQIKDFTWDNGDPNTMERRIDNWTIRIYDLVAYGDALAFSWHHPDNSHPDYEWLDFDYNGAKWNDRDSDCKRSGPTQNCCRTGPWYEDGTNRWKRGIECTFACPPLKPSAVEEA